MFHGRTKNLSAHVGHPRQDQSVKRQMTGWFMSIAADEAATCSCSVGSVFARLLGHPRRTAERPAFSLYNFNHNSLPRSYLNHLASLQRLASIIFFRASSVLSRPLHFRLSSLYRKRLDRLE